jgi:hypothetical protein
VEGVDETGWIFELEVLHCYLVGKAKDSKALPQHGVSTLSALFQDESLTKAVYDLGSWVWISHTALALRFV